MPPCTAAFLFVDWVFRSTSFPDLSAGGGCVSGSRGSWKIRTAGSSSLRLSRRGVGVPCFWFGGSWPWDFAPSRSSAVSSASWPCTTSSCSSAEVAFFLSLSAAFWASMTTALRFSSSSREAAASAWSTRSFSSVPASRSSAICRALAFKSASCSRRTMTSSCLSLSAARCSWRVAICICAASARSLSRLKATWSERSWTMPSTASSGGSCDANRGKFCHLPANEGKDASGIRSLFGALSARGRASVAPDKRPAVARLPSAKLSNKYVVVAPRIRTPTTPHHLALPRADEASLPRCAVPACSVLCPTMENPWSSQIGCNNGCPLGHIAITKRRMRCLACRTRTGIHY